MAQYFKDHPLAGGQLNPSQVASTPGAALPYLRVVHVVSVANSDAAAFAKALTDAYHNVLTEVHSNLHLGSVTFTLIGAGA